MIMAVNELQVFNNQMEDRPVHNNDGKCNVFRGVSS